MGKRELVALLNLSSWCLVMVERLFLAVPRGCLQFVIVVFPDPTHLLILQSNINSWHNSSPAGKELRPYTFGMFKIKESEAAWSVHNACPLHSGRGGGGGSNITYTEYMSSHISWRPWCAFWIYFTNILPPRDNMQSKGVIGMSKVNEQHLSPKMRFPIMWYVRPARPQISLRIRAVWSEPLLVALIFHDC